MSRYVKACSMTAGDVFNVRHDNVLQKIDNIIKDIDDFGEDSEGGGLLKFQEIYFIKSSYKNSQNKEQRDYLLTKRGFTLVAMRFSGKRALKFKTDTVYN